MKSRRLIIGLLITAAFVVSSGTFAYWANNINQPESITTTGSFTIGEGKDVSTSFVLTNDSTVGGALVPATQIDNSYEGATDQITLNYDVKWTEDGTTSQLGETTSTADILIDRKITIKDKTGIDVTDTVGHLIIITPNVANPTNLTLDTEAEMFSFDITMTEPATQAEYNAIANGTITVNFTYSLGTITTTDH